MDVNEVMASDDSDFLNNFESVAVIDNDPVADTGETLDTPDDGVGSNDADATVDVGDESVEDSDEEIEGGETELDDDSQEDSEDDSELDGEEPETNKTSWDNVLNTPVNIGGTDVVFTSPEEVMQAVQNYAKYQQRFANSKTQRDLGAILEKQGIKDSKDVSMLVDIFNGNPKAIAAFIKSKGIDIDSLDVDSDSDYTPKNYQTSESETVFNETVDALSTTTHGQAVLVDANNFDQQSINDIIQDPDILNALAVQKENGVYDKIMSEITRLKAIGQISDSTPILRAYLQVGTTLQNAAKGSTKTTTTESESNPATKLKDKVVIAEGKRKTTSSKPNAEAKKAKAAPNKQPPKDQKITDRDILELSDDDFLRNFGKLNKV